MPARLEDRSLRSQILWFWLAMLLPLLSALALAYQIQQLQAATRVVARTYEAIHRGYQLEKLFSDLQLSVHAYALTGDEMFLDTYRRARASWPEASQAAGALVQGDEMQALRLQRVERAVNESLTYWEGELATLRPGGDDQTAWMLIGEDKARTRRISRTITDFVASEQEVIAARTRDQEQARARLYAGAVGSGVVSVGVFLVFAAIFAHSVARPIEQVAAAAHHFGGGRWDQRVRPSGAKESRVLATAFNQMADSLQRAQELLDARNRQLEQITARLATANEDLLERQRETDDFLYVLSHDLRAPLINIQGFGKRLHTDMAVLQKVLPESSANGAATQLGRMAESLQFVNAGAAKIDQLIARLLEVARLTSRRSPSQWIDTQTIVRDVIRACHFQLEEQRIAASIGTLPRVFADPVQLNQVFTNLVDNAIKYMGKRPRKRITITCTEQNDRYRFAVADTGPGIAPRDRDKVFRMFTRLAGQASRGEGIGLAAVRTIVNRHGGRIWVEAGPDGGCVFYFTLPRVSDDAATPGKTNPVAAPAASPQERR